MARKKKTILETEELVITVSADAPLPVTALADKPPVPSVPPAPLIVRVREAYEEWGQAVGETLPAWGSLTELEKRGFQHAAESLRAGRPPQTRFDIIFLKKD